VNIQNVNAASVPERLQGYGSAAALAAAAAERTRPGLQADVREVLRTINRRKWLILLVVAAVVGIAAGVLSQLTPRYTATTLVMLDTRKTKVTDVEAVVSGLTTDVPALQSEVELLRSRTMMGRVVDKLNLVQDPEFNGRLRGSLMRDLRARLGVDALFPRPAAPSVSAAELERSSVVDALLGRTTVVPRGRSFVIAISAESADRVKAARIANTLADFYIVDQLETKFEATRRASAWLEDKLGDLRSQVQTAERAVAQYRERNRLTETRDSNVVVQQLGELNSQLTLARAQSAEKAARLRQLEEMIASRTATDSVAEVLQNPLIQRLREQEAELARREADLSARYGANHPRMVNIKAEAADLQGKIAGEIRKITAALGNEVRVARVREQSLQSQLNTLERQAGDLGRAGVELRQLEREAQSSRTLYENFLNRFKETSQQQDIQQPDARVISQAVVPSSASYPRSTLILAMAFVAGIVLAAALVVMLERMDAGFRSVAQIEDKTGHATLGAVPFIGGALRGAKSSPHNYIVSKPASSFGEALRSVHTALLLNTVDTPAKVMMVTSSVPGEGKSTFCLSLARLLAMGGQRRRVVLVDLDLRRPMLEKSLGIKAKAYVDEYILGTRPLEDVIGIDEKTNLHYVCARPKTSTPVELLESDKMRQFIEALSRSYDVVMLDTPPVLAVADARVVSTIADYVVFLVRWEKTPREVVLHALKLISEGGKRIGVALNQVNVRKQGYYGYGDYGYYYGRYKKYYTD
jgi:succinoglycan biosynthesis transport protein ExoP